MPKRLAPGNRTIWAGAVLCLAAGGYLSWQLWRSDAPPPPPPPAAAEDAPAPARARPDDGEAGFELADAGDYADVVERPLFNRTRRPPAADEAARAAAGGAGGAEEVAAANLSLAGVLLTRGRKVALLRIDNDPKVMHVGEGQQAGGWLIEKIRPDRVILRRGDTSGEVVLDYRRLPEGAARAGGRPGGSPGAPPGAPPGSPPGGSQIRKAGRPPQPPDVQDEEEVTE